MNKKQSPQIVQSSFDVTPASAGAGSRRQPRAWRTQLAIGLSAAVFALAPLAHAGPNDASALSAISMLPVAVSVVAPGMVLSAGAQLSVKAVESTAEGSLLVLERLSDGAQVSMRLTGKVLERSALKVGSAVEASATGAGMILSAAGSVIAFVPNEIGRTLLHHEPISR